MSNKKVKLLNPAPSKLVINNKATMTDRHTRMMICFQTSRQTARNPFPDLE